MRTPISRRRGFRAAVLAMILIGGWASASMAAYHLIRKVPIGGEGWWDFLRMDADARRLYVTRGTHVIVLDIDSLKVVGDIPNTPGVHGVALAPEFGRGFTSNGADTSSAIFDSKDDHPLGRVRTGYRPDAIVYDPASKRVFTMNGGSRDATAIDAAKGAVVGSVALGGRPEEAVPDGSGRLFVNIEDSSAVVVVDTRKLATIARWPLAPGEGPSGIALDAEHHRLFSVCGNQLMVVMDSETGRVVATLPIGKSVDGVAFDPGKNLAFSSNGEGNLTVVREETPDKFSVAETVPTQAGARTIALDAKTHRVFTVTAEFGPAPSPTPENPRPRRAIIPGSFVLLVLGE